MADKTVNIDGSLTLDETRDRCIVEQNAGYQLQGIQNATIPQGGEALLVNKADFVHNLDFLPELLFVAPGPNNPETVKKDQNAQGWTFLCTGAIYIQEQITNMMVFGK